MATEWASEESPTRIVMLEKALAQERARANEEHARAERERARADAATAERDRLREAYRQLQFDLELLRRRLFVAKAERVDTRQLELEFADKQAALTALGEQLGPALAAEPSSDESAAGPMAPPGEEKPKHKPTGRRDLRTLALDEERLELLDPELEGKAERIDFEESVLLGWRKGGLVRIIVARAKYRVLTEAGTVEIVTTAMPKRTFGRSLAAPSLLARILTDKYCDGLPLYRQEERFARDGVTLDRGTMCRWAEDCGMTAGCVVLAMRKEAFETAFCIATDATGVAVQPEPSKTGQRQPCRKGHFFVLLADRDHILFEYMPRETSEAVAEMFKGYSGYVQADAKSVYDILFRQPGPLVDDGEGCEEVGCWSHCRRKFYEAAIAKHAVAREALFRIHRLFKNEQPWTALPPAKRKALRLQFSKPLVDDFFAWAAVEFAKVKDQRGLLRSAFGYAVRQREALSRFLDDGRLRLDNNGSERELRRIAVGRKAWLFVGSDDHAQAAANLFSLIASCKLHRLDPEAYLRDLFRVLAHWPSDRYLELAPRYWAATRARLVAAELAKPLGPLTIPPPEQQPPSR
jgi:transposase